MNALALLGAGVDPEERVVCNHTYRVGNAIFHCDTTHGPIAMHDAISRSCDIYFYTMGRRVGIQTLAPMMRHMGYGQRFDLPFPSQRYGTVPDPAWLMRREHREWQEYDTVNVSIGQGYLLVNPMQQAIQAARIASGRALHPRLLHSDPVNVHDPLPIPPEHLAFVRDAMMAVVNVNGTARGAPAAGRRRADGRQDRHRPGPPHLGGRARRRRAVEQQPRLADARSFACSSPSLRSGRRATPSPRSSSMAASAPAPPRLWSRDVMTYLFDKDRAMAALIPMERQWGGSIAERMERQAEQWAAAHAPGAAPTEAT